MRDEYVAKHNPNLFPTTPYKPQFSQPGGPVLSDLLILGQISVLFWGMGWIFVRIIR